MGTTKPRICAPKCHRAVDWNEKAIQKVIDRCGYVLAGVKVDGMRCHVLFDHMDGVRFITREGIEIKALGNYRDYFKRHWESMWRLHPDLILDCEVWIPGETFEAGSGLLRRDEPLPADKVPQFVMLDVMPRSALLAEYTGETSLPKFTARNASLIQRFPRPFGTNLAGPAPIVCEALARVESIDKIRETYLVARSLGYEGLVVKDPELGVRNGKVNGMWKVKPGCGAPFAPGWEGDGRIIGYVWGDDDKANAGKIVGFRVALEDGTEVNATGLTKEQMDKFTRAVLTVPYGAPATADVPHIGRYCEVHAMERTSLGSLRHPSFFRFRDLDYCPGVKA